MILSIYLSIYSTSCVKRKGEGKEKKNWKERAMKVCRKSEVPFFLSPSVPPFVLFPYHFVVCSMVSLLVSFPCSWGLARPLHHVHHIHRLSLESRCSVDHPFHTLHTTTSPSHQATSRNTPSRHTTTHYHTDHTTERTRLAPWPDTTAQPQPSPRHPFTRPKESFAFLPPF